MTLEFQKELLQFLVQSRNGVKYVDILEPDVFDLDNQYTVLGLVKGFVKQYRTQPSLANLLEYFDRQVKESNSNIGDEVYSTITETIREAYEKFTGNADFIREVIIEQYQIKLMKSVFAENMLDLKNGKADIVKSVFSEVSKIHKLADNDDEEANRGRFALEEFKKGQRSVIDATPTYLKSLNRMMSTRGFYAPQLIVFMGAPKSFKTGTALNLAINFVRDGYKVYYVDCENGEDRILDRFYQGMLQATWEEYNSGELDDTLEEMVQRFKILGGDFRSDYYPAATKSMADVEENLQYLEEEHNWFPDLIVYDYLDLMKPEDYKIKEKRLMIQAVYHDAIRLQKRRNIFGISLSQVNKNAVNKAVIDMTGFAEDFGKAANVHAAFALSRTEEEKEAGVMRIVPVVQRDGVAQHSNFACFVEVEEAKMAIREIKHSEWEERVNAAKSGITPEKPKKKSNGPRGQKTVKDE